MAVTFQNKDEFAGRVYPFHVEPVKRDIMGYKLTDVEKGTIVPQGTPIVADMDNKTAVICKHAKVVKKVSTTKFIVDYVGFLTVGTKVFCSGETTPTLSEISAIDKTTKEITLKAANSQLDAGKILVEGESGSDSSVTAKNVPNRIIARTQKMTELDKTVSATHQAIVIQNVVDYPAEWLNTETFPGSTLLKGCPLILFVKQKKIQEDKIMNENSFFFSDIYKEATDVIKNIMDEATQKHLDIFGKVWFKDHFSLSRYPRTESEFTAILEEVHAAPAASTINEFSERPIRSLDGFGKVKAQMLSIGHTYKLEAEDLRAIRDMQRRYAGIKNHEELVRFIVDKLMDVRTKAIQGVLNRQDLLILSMLSNDGKYTFTDENDPGSPFIGQTLDFGFDTSHAATVTTPWIDTNIDTVDVLEDIMSTIAPATIKPTDMYMERERVFYMLRTKKLKLYVNGSDRASQPISVEDMNALFARFDLPVIKLVQREVRVDSNGGKTTKTINPWKTGKILFTVGSQFGTIERKITDAEDGLQSPGVGYSYYDGIEVMNWTQGVKEGTNYTEYVSTGLTSTPVVDGIRNMYSLDTKAS